MKLRRAVIGALAAMLALAGSLAFAAPAQADVPPKCNTLGYDNGRHVYLNNDDNGGGAFVSAFVCFEANGSGLYNTYVEWGVTDTAANGAGATIRMEWLDSSGVKRYDVPPSSQRAWALDESATGTWDRNSIEQLYVRACLTNTDSEGHHCGAKG
ncbi:hypothetical protein [Glycomyces dulcitolivorans]|uniref:hypothetical protein n=1 Tax=Glycomyces dulcitolivorans TaxID=2200759 RepID=UPI000DD49152|nr:hypothetical protein [Glycomyces dulcitolivorans]